jgi:hypothetical protein
MHANYWALWALHRHSLFLHAQVASWPGHDSCGGGIPYRLGSHSPRLRCASASSQQIYESGAQCHRWLHWPKIWDEQLSCRHAHSACAINQELVQASMRLGSEGFLCHDPATCVRLGQTTRQRCISVYGPTNSAISYPNWWSSKSIEGSTWASPPVVLTRGLGAYFSSDPTWGLPARRYD